MRPLEVEDLYKFISVSSPKISPDGSKVAFVTTKVNREDDTYDSRIWIMDLHLRKPVYVTDGPLDYSPSWSNNGEYLAFLRRVKDTVELHILNAPSLRALME